MSILETERLLLRPLHADDLAAMIRVRGDVAVMRYSLGVETAEQVGGWLQRCMDSYRKHDYGAQAVIEKETREVLGFCGISDRDIDGRTEVELGYRLAYAHWNRGFATEAATAVRDDAFGRLRMTRLIALIDPQNAASIRVAEKLGMHYERDVMLAGYTHPDRMYVVTANPR